jgi:hypothetical protein
MNAAKTINKAEWATRQEVCELLEIKDNTLSQYISKGKIPSKAIAKGIAKNKLFHLPTLFQTPINN